MKKGQLVRIHTKDKNGTGWSYGVVYSMFDNLIIYQRCDGKLYSETVGENTENLSEDFYSNDFNITEPLKNGKIVMTKKDLFGSYKLDKKYYQFD